MKTEIDVKTAELYSSKVQYGFIVEENRRGWKKLQIPELNSGFSPVYWYAEENITHIDADFQGCVVEDNEDGRLPETFAVKVSEEGNYQVSLTLYANEDVNQAIVFLGRRRLAYIGTLQRNQAWSGTFLVNVCPIIPRNYKDVMIDDTIDITVLGSGLHIQHVGVEHISCPTVYIAGDSTVTDQSADYPYYPYHSYAGWGQMLSFYMGESAAVSNHSHSGLTTESFRSEGHYKIMYERMHEGDICLIQFGHNDQKLKPLCAGGGYRTNLIRYISEMKEKGVTPVLVTPLARNTWKGNEDTYNDLLEGYAEECIRLAREYKIPLLDLHARSKTLVLELGREEVKKYYFPSDYTHSNDYGAYLFAGYVFDEMRKNPILHKLVMHNRSEEQVERLCKTVWEMPEKFEAIEPPENLADIVNPNEEVLFENLERPEELLTRVEALELIITAMHFFPTNVYNDAFEDVDGHETYAGTIECAFQNGLIPNSLVENHRIYPNRQVSGKEFIQIAGNGYRSRKGTGIPSEISDEIVNQKCLTRSKAADICRRLHI